MFPRVTMPRINLHTHTKRHTQELKLNLCRARQGVEWWRDAVFLVSSQHPPSLVHYRRLVEALLLEDFDGLLAADGWQDGEGGRQVQTLQLQVPPPDGRREMSEFDATTCRGNLHKRRICPLITHHGFFTMRSSSLRKPLFTIHLSLRNLDLDDEK